MWHYNQIFFVHIADLAFCHQSHASHGYKTILYDEKDIMHENAIISQDATVDDVILAKFSSFRFSFM